MIRRYQLEMTGSLTVRLYMDMSDMNGIDINRHKLIPHPEGIIPRLD